MTTAFADRWGFNEAQFWLRGTQPEQTVAASDRGWYDVHGYPEALRILSDTNTFSSNTFRVMPSAPASDALLIQLDPPIHTKFRTLVSHAFTPKMVNDLEPRVAEIATELLDQVAGQDRFELIEDLAYPLPVIVIAELLGIPASERDLFKQWVDDLLANFGEFSLNDRDEKQKKQFEFAMRQRQHLLAYLTEHAAERKHKPRDDLLTKLIEAEVDGESLTPAEVAIFANLLLVAGHITATMLLGNTTLCLDAHGLWSRVHADRSVVPGAIEESLRFLAPFASVSRVTNAEVTFGDITVPADTMLMLWLGSANRDPRAFTAPDRFDPARDPNPHIAFGRGIHFCLGAPLARLEGRVAMNLLLDRYPNLRSDPDSRPEMQPSPNLTGVSKLGLLSGCNSS